ncbi:hypothetical protein LL912_24485 [Niabella sp. CC-SYL272]|uniref:hypothetical protein n=1 Tax=Niabella agricola TaxID=2891571 RepID=UPI001F1ADD65|nr:hypothetical protein [Niabella agricola]MCF3111969.1 hypothetical protein [Niabella agricola]
MDLKELKSGWQQAGGAFKSETDLLRMTKMINHPSMKKIRTRLIIEVIALLFILFVYYDWFDGGQKPFYANLALITGLLLYIANDVIGFVSIMKPIQKTNLKDGIQEYLMRLKRLSVFSVIIAVLYTVSIIIFFMSTINLTKEKGLILVFSSVIMVQLILLSFNVWKKRIHNLEKQAMDFITDETTLI